MRIIDTTHDSHHAVAEFWRNNVLAYDVSPQRDGWFRTPDLSEFDGTLLSVVKWPSAGKILK